LALGALQARNAEFFLHVKMTFLKSRVVTSHTLYSKVMTPDDDKLRKEISNHYVHLSLAMGLS
jgi:hypothetical protein